jgi:hypothetical protein
MQWFLLHSFLSVTQPLNPHAICMFFHQGLCPNFITYVTKLQSLWFNLKMFEKEGRNKRTRQLQQVFKTLSSEIAHRAIPTEGGGTTDDANKRPQTVFQQNRLKEIYRLTSRDPATTSKHQPNTHTALNPHAICM